MAEKIPAYGVCRVTAADTEIDILVEEVLRCGYAVADSGFSDEEISRYRLELDEVYAIQQQEVGGEENLERINDANVTRCLLAYDETFLSMATHSLVLKVSERILGSSFVLLMQNGVINPPQQKHFQVSWHRDLNYQHWVSSQPLALSALFCLDPFSEATGGTYVLPGTHLKEEFPSPTFVHRHEQVVEAPAGSIILFDSMMFHRAGHNSSAIIRRAVNHVIGVPILAQQISIPDMLAGAYADDPFLARYLGYRWKPQPSVSQWRLQRLDAAQKGSQRKAA
jgi:ectoine hydroxylase-related dioxygenase (phytanoyl-CoA dioxygenase family)